MSRAVPPAEAQGPSDSVRSLVSFLLFLHLFAIGVGVLSRATEGAPLETRLRDVPGVLPYIGLLGIDWPYTYFLMGPLHTGQPDYDFRMELELKLADGTTKTIWLPDSEQMSRARRHRYQHLVSTAVTLLQAPTFESRLPEGIARDLVRVEGATGGTIRIHGKTMPEEVFQTLPANYPATPMYEARIIVSGEHVSLFKLDSAAESAPASSSSSAAPNAPATPPTALPGTPLGVPSGS